MRRAPANATGYRHVRLTKPSTVSHLTVEEREAQCVLLELRSVATHPKHRTEVILRPHARLTLVILWCGKGKAQIRQRVRVERGAKLHVIALTRGSCTHELTSEVVGGSGESTIDWVVHARRTATCTLTARNHFRAKEGRGDVTMRGVVEGKAHVHCTGAIAVGPKAAGTETKLTERILLLDRAAKADAIPELIVETHAVKVSHAASVSRIPLEDLFYFASRGIEERKARRMIIEGFLHAPLEHLPTDLRASVVRAIGS